MKMLILSFLIMSPVFAEQVKVDVNGMVCSLCAQGIKKKFTGLGIEKVDVDLDKKVVLLENKDKIAMTNEKISELIKESGYATVSIERK